MAVVPDESITTFFPEPAVDDPTWAKARDIGRRFLGSVRWAFQSPLWNRKRPSLAAGGTPGKCHNRTRAAANNPYINIRAHHINIRAHPWSPDG